MKTILIADDSAFMRKWLRNILEKHAYVVIAEAANGIDAVRLYQKHHPEMVLLDIIMPVTDGLTALKKIKQLDQCANIIIVSSLATKENVMVALQHGAKDFIIKPYFHNLIPTLEKISKP